MAYVPFAFREREPCGACGSRSYTAPEHGNCEFTKGKVFCNAWCRMTYRVRVKYQP